VLVASAVCAVALAASPSALAHATLIFTEPSRGELLARSPERVLLRFDEPVSTVSGSVRVFDSNARRVDLGKVTKASSDTVAVGLPADLPDDT
jgi:copper transport protein